MCRVLKANFESIVAILYSFPSAGGRFFSVSLLIPYSFSNYCGEWKPNPTFFIPLNTPKKRPLVVCLLNARSSAEISSISRA